MYTGLAQDMTDAVHRLKSNAADWFVRKYRCTQLVWYKSFPSIDQAIEWQETLNWRSRSQKVALIEHDNPHWHDMSAAILRVPT